MKTIPLTEDQAARLEDCRKAFNNFTGANFSPEKFAAHCVEEMICDNQQAARNVGKLGFSDNVNITGAGLVN